ncbi:hypothetical protein HY967_03205 [Candidatus Jorgensenbacteria bacterium]|nr:hypothetical protein [Candidatus Jorgensenbacteria bacterium]
MVLLGLVLFILMSQIIAVIYNQTLNASERVVFCSPGAFVGSFLIWPGLLLCCFIGDSRLVAGSVAFVVWLVLGISSYILVFDVSGLSALGWLMATTVVWLLVVLFLIFSGSGESKNNTTKTPS